MVLDEKIIVYTENPARELLSTASRTHLNLNELDFNLLAFSTQYRFGDGEWKKISEKDLTLFDKDEIFLKNDLQIKQEYKIEIFHSKEPSQISQAVKLIANKKLTKIIAQIDLAGLKSYDKLPLELLQNIYKKMLKLKFLIGIRIFDFKKNLLAFCNRYKNSTLNKTTQIIVATGIEPMRGQDEFLSLVYKEKARNYTLDEKRLGIIAVDENEVVLRHIKAKQGREGKDLNLHPLRVLSPNENKIIFSCSSAFKQIEQEEYTEYLALKKGFVVENANSFDIANELDFQEVEFKKVGVIKAGLDKNVKININFVSELKDAVNSGVEIECEELNINGSVGSNTQLKATKMKIEGTTHSKAKMSAKEAYIKTHRGFVEAEILNIDLLEGGTVKAKEVKIKKSLGGNIQADKIYIEDLESNNTCIFFENSTIERIKGRNNKFNAKVKMKDKNYDEEFKALEEQSARLSRKLDKIKAFIKASKNTISSLEKTMTELKNSGQKIPAGYEKALKNFSLQNQELAKLQNEEKQILERKKALQLELSHLQELLFKANFINKSGKWTDMNELRFSLLEPKEELFFSSLQSENARVIGIEKIMQNNKESAQIYKKLNYEEKDMQWLSPSKE